MPILAPMVESTAAEREALANWNNNLAALRVNQPTVAEILEAIEPNVHWIFARDGSLTAMDEDGKWWGGCSVPLLAGRSVLKTLEALPTGSCLLAPAHAGLLRAARERMGASPVLLVVQPDVQVGRMIFSCCDVSKQIAMHRFWVVTGDEWSEQLRQVFDDHPGLATPTRFIRTKWTGDHVVTPMITTAQEVFSAVLSERNEKITSIKSGPIHLVNRSEILLIGGSEFCLWDEGPAVLEQQLAGSSIHRFDTDDALNGSPLALLDAAAACGSVVSANLCRADCNQLISAEMPWITWITQPAVPTFESAGPKDALVLADANWRNIARKAGWPENCVRVCGWPRRSIRHLETTVKSELAIICDTQKIEIPASVKGYSSHRLLWELIEEELHADPLAVEKVEDYLADRAGQLNISMDVIDRQSFVMRLIIPAYQQGLARLLIAEGLPIGLHGNAWADLAEFTADARGNISSRDELDAAVAASAGLIYCWPQQSAHPMDAMAKPVVHRAGRDRSQLVRNARRVLTGPKTAVSAANHLGQLILELISPNCSNQAGV